MLGEQRIGGICILHQVDDAEKLGRDVRAALFDLRTGVAGAVGNGVLEPTLASEILIWGEEDVAVRVVDLHGAAEGVDDRRHLQRIALEVVVVVENVRRLDRHHTGERADIDVVGHRHGVGRCQIDVGEVAEGDLFDPLKLILAVAVGHEVAYQNVPGPE